MATSDLEDVLSNLAPKRRDPRLKRRTDREAKNDLPEEGTGGETKSALPKEGLQRVGTVTKLVKYDGEAKNDLPEEGMEGETKSALPKEGSQRVGTVTKLVKYGAFVRLDGLDRDAFLRVSEIADHYVESEELQWYLEPGKRIEVLVEKVEVESSGKVNIAVSMRPSKVRRIVPDDFDPLTLAVFDLPYDMMEGEVKNLFGEYGCVTEVELFPMHTLVVHDGFQEEDESRRKFTLVTFEERDQGMECMRKLHRRVIPYQIGRETYQFRISVKLSKRQDFKERLQAKWDEEFQERRNNANPEMRRANRMADKFLRDIIPYYGYH